MCVIGNVAPGCGRNFTGVHRNVLVTYPSTVKISVYTR